MAGCAWCGGSGVVICEDCMIEQSMAMGNPVYCSTCEGKGFVPCACTERRDEDA